MKAEVEAYAYFLIASQSYEGAREQRDILKNRLSKSQKAVGQQRAKEIQASIEEKVKLQAKANNIQTTGFQIGEKYYYNFDDTHDCNHNLEITTNGKKLSIKKLKFYGEAQIHDLDFTGSINPDDKTGDLKLEVATNDSASISGEVGNIILMVKNRYGESRGVGPSRYQWKISTNPRAIKQENWQSSKSGLSRSILNELSRIDAAIERTVARIGQWIY